MAVPYQNVAKCRDVKVYPKCVLKAANVDRVSTLSRNRPPCSWTFSTSWFFHAATSGIRDTIPTSLLLFEGNIFIPLLYIIENVYLFVCSR